MKQVKSFCICLPLLMAILVQGCFYDNEQDLFPIIGECDTTQVTYALTIQPLMEKHCYECHDNSNAPALGGNIRLHTYTNVEKIASDGSFAGSISYNPDYYPMPVDYKLDECTVKQIKAWINYGAPDN